MGRQVNFYATSEDEYDLIMRIGRLALIKLARASFKHKSDMIISDEVCSLSSLENFTDGGFIYNPAIEPKLIIEFNNYNGEFSVDITNSEVIEFTPCTWIDKNEETFLRPGNDPFLSSGRLWFDTTYLSMEDGKPALYYKSDAFLSWGDKVLRRVRRNWHYDGKGIYISPEAKRLSDEKKLQLGPSTFGFSNEEIRQRLGLSP